MMADSRLSTIAALSLMLSACVPWTVRPIDDEKTAAAGSSTGANATAFVESMWSSKLLPALANSAVDARTLIDALAKSRPDAAARYGHREGNGPVYFVVKGEGRVTSVDTRSWVGLALLDVAPFDQKPHVSIQIGPVLRGTSLRDATGLVRFTDFVNQLQFADVGNELNDRVSKTVLSGIDVANLKGKRVSFLGTAIADAQEPQLRELVAVQLAVVAQ